MSFLIVPRPKKMFIVIVEWKFPIFYSANYFVLKIVRQQDTIFQIVYSNWNKNVVVNNISTNSTIIIALKWDSQLQFPKIRRRSVSKLKESEILWTKGDSSHCAICLCLFLAANWFSSTLIDAPWNHFDL